MLPGRLSFFRVLTVVGGLVVAFVVGEVGLRLAGSVTYREPPGRRPESVWRETVHRPSSVPGLAYELAPNIEKFSHKTKIRTNSHGMRDEEPLAGDTVKRIAVVGDSYTFGSGVEQESIYPIVLQRLLNSTDSEASFKVDVLNFGVSGYSTRDEAVVVERKVLSWNPSTVIIGYVLNDPEIRPVQPLHSYFHVAEWWQHSHALRLLAHAKNNLDVWRYGGGDYLRFLHSHQAHWSSVEAAFGKIATIGERQGFEVLLVIFPRLEGPWDEYPYTDIHAQVAQAGAANGFHTLDLHDLYAEHEPMDLRVGKTNRHPNGFGHLLAAEAIRTTLLESPSLFFGE